jgi:hypothetical protein
MGYIFRKGRARRRATKLNPPYWGGVNVALALRYSQPRRPQTVPAEMAGKFVAWSSDGLRILGAGDTAREACDKGGGHADTPIEWIPPREELRAGSAREYAAS